MRTRIEIDDGQREKLLALAAERGERGCGRVVQEAVTFYLEQKDRPPAMLHLEPQPPLTIEVPLPESRRERARLVIGWVLEEAVGLVSLARHWRGRLRRSAAQTA
jgi:hypothetical protein